MKTYSRYLNPFQTVKRFVSEYLGGDIQKLKTFDFMKLEKDKTYGCSGRSFDCDDTDIARAIYVIVYKKAFPDLSMETLDDKKYRGDTMNTFRTLMGKFTENHAECEDVYNIPVELAEKIHRFIHTYHTIGNFVPLPNAKTTKTLNMMRSSLWNDYFDRFWSAVEKYLYEESYHEKFTPLMEANDYAFAQYKGTEDGFARLTNLLMLDGYTNSGSLLKFLGLTLRKKWPEEAYLQEVEHYFDFCTALIEDRTDRIIKVLKNKLKDENMFTRTIAPAAYKKIDGVENLTSVLGENDNYNLHDSQVRTLNYDMVNQTMNITIEVVGSELSSMEYDIFLDMHFSEIVSVNLKYDDFQYIDEFRVYWDGRFICCDFEGVAMQIACCSMKIDPVRFVECEKRKKYM